MLDNNPLSNPILFQPFLPCHKVSAPCQGSGSSLAASLPVFMGVFPDSGTFSFHTLFPGMLLEVSGQLALPTGWKRLLLSTDTCALSRDF